MDASDTMRVAHTTTSHTANATSTPQGASARKTPALVATPLPPRKRTQTENTCPKMAAAP
ncbi:hypothetical protein D3C83_245620 [compost metagenome]